MTLLVELTVFTAYRQVAIFDAAARESYPEWDAESTTCAIGPHGVAVALAGNNEDVPVEVHEAYESADVPRCTATIVVGSSGLTVGNVVGDTLAAVQWPAGRALVQVYVDEIAEIQGGDPGTTRGVVFSLERAE
jgi:hypothetical protein